MGSKAWKLEKRAAKRPPKPPAKPESYASFIATLHDIIWAFLNAAGPAACVATTMLTFVYYKIYCVIWVDHLKISARWAPGKAAAFYDAPKPSTLMPKLKAMFRKADAEAPAPADPPPPVADEPIIEKSIGGRYADGALDIVHNFAYPGAAIYPPLFFFTSVLAYILVWIIWELIFMAFIFKMTRTLILGLFGASMVVPILMGVLESTLIKQIFVKSTIKLPRTYLLYDFCISFTLALTAGVSNAFTRLITGLISAYLKLVFLSEPVLPSQLGTSDAGFSAYGGLMKTRYMVIMEELKLVSHHYVTYTPAPEWELAQKEIEDKRYITFNIQTPAPHNGTKEEQL